jgi:23S rRNA (cytosine1962-C5)-methyltransferase
VADSGFLVSSSCSYRLDRERLIDLVARAAHRTGRFAQVVAQGGQGPDHPVHPRLPESEYLKTVVARLVAEGDPGETASPQGR